MARTIDNLMKMVSDGAVASIQYSAFAEVAEKEGYNGVAKTFRAVAKSKSFHALSHFRAANRSDTTLGNLRQALEEETYDYKNAYPSMIQDAVDDEALEARHSFEYGMSIGPIIAKFLSKAIGDLNANLADSFYICPVCGNIEYGKPPDKCPFCGVDAGRFVEVG